MGDEAVSPAEGTDRATISRRSLGRRAIAQGSAVVVGGALAAEAIQSEPAGAAVTPASWHLKGNSGSSSDFLGTTTAEALVIKTNGAERMVVDESGEVGIGTTSPFATLHVVSTTGTGLFQATETGASVTLEADCATNGQGTAVFGLLTSSTPGDSQAVLGRVSSTTDVSAVGVQGLHEGGGTGVYGQAMGSDATGVLGAAPGTNGTGVFGQATGTGGYGVVGDAPQGTGVHGEAGGSAGIAVSGSAAAGTGVQGTTGNVSGLGGFFSNPNTQTTAPFSGGVAVRALGSKGSYTELRNTAGGLLGGFAGGEFAGQNGVIGAASGESDNTVGVAGLAPGNPGGIGVLGYGSRADRCGVYGSGPYGVQGESNYTAGIGVYGVQGAGSLALATEGPSELVGDVLIIGNLSKSSGTFKIDHPVDPANMYLSHSFVESPDMMNVYNGTVVMDDRGEATVALPDWFEALNRDFRYQLTPIGAFAPLFIAAKVAEGQFRIGGGTPGLEVSWQLTGIRQDAFAEAHRTPVEEEKAIADRGRYLHPELFEDGLGRPLSAVEKSRAHRRPMEVPPTV